LKTRQTAGRQKDKRPQAPGDEREASARKGSRFRFSPDLLAPSEIKSLLTTKWMGRTIHHFQTIDSTNSKAYQLAMQGAEEGEVVVAESQDKGRGRLGRPWYSPPFLNLYLSIILRPKIPPHQASLLTLLAAVATADAVREISGLLPLIKWPNDILLGGRKVAGLLNELHSGTDRVHFAILGIGINLNMDGKSFSKEIRKVATSLKKELGRPVSRAAFLRVLLQKLEAWYETLLNEGAGPVLEAWRDRARIKGRPVRVASSGETLTGRAVDIDTEGNLIIKTEDGHQKIIVAGDVEYDPKENGDGRNFPAQLR
jgi:BirA family biotin operon repressor/biotin-[acetyl-CoA-carboxylase] ligase